MSAGAERTFAPRPSSPALDRKQDSEARTPSAGTFGKNFCAALFRGASNWGRPYRPQQEKGGTHCGLSTLGGKANQLPTRTAAWGSARRPSMVPRRPRHKGAFPCYEVYVRAKPTNNGHLEAGPGMSIGGAFGVLELFCILL